MKDKNYEYDLNYMGNDVDIITNIAKLIDKGLIKVQDLNENQKDNLINYYVYKIGLNKEIISNINKIRGS